MLSLPVILGMVVLVAALVAMDLGLLTRRPRTVTPAESALSALLWVVAAALVALLMARAYADGALQLAGVADAARAGRDAWLQFITAYVTELALSLDNVAVIALVFAHFSVRPELRARVMMWVVVACLVQRAVLITAGTEFMRLDWVRWVFAAGLLAAAARSLLMPSTDEDLGKRLLIRLTHRLPTAEGEHGQRLLVRQAGRWRFTSLMMVFLAAAAADASFAIDSLPAVLAVTRDPVIAFTSNALALLALRAISFAVTPVMGRFRYLRISLTLILLYLAVRTAFRESPWLTVETTLGVVTGVMGLGVMASAAYRRWLAPAGGDQPRPAPIEDLAEAALAARRNVWKMAILIVGTVVILGGIAIAPLPGPGPLVLVPLGLGILATEFLWARRLLAVFREKSEALARQGDRVGALFPKWMLVPIVLAYYGGFAALYLYTPLNKTFVIFTAAGLSLPLGVWVYRVARRRREPVDASAGRGAAGGDDPSRGSS